MKLSKVDATVSTTPLPWPSLQVWETTLFFLLPFLHPFFRPCLPFTFGTYPPTGTMWFRSLRCTFWL